MSVQAVLNFMHKANEDKALYEKVNALSSNRVSDLIEVARGAGFEFTSDEFASAISNELTDSDLGQIAGGAIYMNSTAPTLPTAQMSLNFTKFGG